MLIDKEKSLLLIIDVQENLTPVQESPRGVISGCATLLEVANELSIPSVVAEQDHLVFGQTMIDLRNVLKKDTKYYEKDTFFSAGGMLADRRGLFRSPERGGGEPPDCGGLHLPGVPVCQRPV